MEACAHNPSYLGGRDRRIVLEASLGKISKTLSEK
jgi:hypothetical protein